MIPELPGGWIGLVALQAPAPETPRWPGSLRCQEAALVTPAHGPALREAEVEVENQYWVLRNIGLTL